MTAVSLFAAAQGVGLLEYGRTCRSALFYVPGSALLVAIMAGLLIWLRHPARYAVTDRRALSSASRIQRSTRVGTGVTELPCPARPSWFCRPRSG
ncbi:hypothetical protein PE067_14500 [Paracoccus sp. DMF-8]|uniref:hypothetical protein n=1 Tax=Paracoccus sp. DMF-8 TaxID=3019445 RepID=UPI0023E3B41B|nr:hypothetical protein [Paracoccus sp. DMF-8]MDF3607229.1 hypothetical protein [Paracoccus sp. DMF-8]